MLRWMSAVFIEDKITSKLIDSIGVASILDKIRENRSM